MWTILGSENVCTLWPCNVQPFSGHTFTFKCGVKRRSVTGYSLITGYNWSSGWSGAVTMSCILSNPKSAVPYRGLW